MTTNTKTTTHTLLSFLSSNAHRVWHGKHLFESTNKIMRFCDYADFGTRSIDSFVPEDIYMFSDHLLETGICKNTVNKYFAAISSLLKYAHDMRVIEQYHIPRIKWFKVKSGRPRFMSKTELHELEDFFSGHQNSWVADFHILASQTGMRLGEIRKIKPADYHMDDKGKHVLQLYDTKNGDDRRLKLNMRAYEALLNLDFEPSNYWSHSKFYRTWHEARRRIAPGDKHFVGHTLRHTTATTLASNKYNLALISKIMGHRSLATTARYIHEDASVVDDAMDSLL
jgi:integrase